MATNRDWVKCDELIDACMEWIGMHWTKSMIKRQIREIADDKNLTDRTCIGIINRAYRKIRELYGIDPQEFKGIQIEFYRTIIRKTKEKTKDKLAAAERLDKLFGLETISGVDPEVLAHKVREALIGMEASMGRPDNVEKQNTEQGNEHEGDGKVEAADCPESNREGAGQGAQSNGTNEGDSKSGTTTSAIDISSVAEDKDITEEMAEEIGGISDKDWEQFRKDNDLN